MDGQVLAKSIMSLQGKDLRVVYALFSKTNLGNLVSSKAKDTLAKLSKEESNHFINHLEEEAEKLESVSDEVIQVDLFLDLTKQLQLTGKKYLLPREIDEQCDAIINSSYELLYEKDKKFQAFAQGQAHRTKLQRMINYQMYTLFKNLDDDFNKLSDQDMREIASQVTKYIKSLPEEKQKLIKEKLGIDELTDDLIRKAIVTSSVSFVFATIVEISGFAFYTTATTLLFKFASFFGLTLPFAAYTTLTSTIAVIANPLFLFILLFGGGAYIVNRQNKSLKNNLLPITIMQITLPYLSQSTNLQVNESYQLFIEEWKRRFNRYKNSWEQLRKAELEREMLISEIRRLENELHIITKQIKNEENSIKIEKNKIFSALEKELEVGDIETLPINDRKKIKYRQIHEKINLLHQQITTNNFERSIIGKVKNALSKMESTRELRKEKKNLKQLLREMVEDVINSNSTFNKVERESILRSEESITKFIKEKGVKRKELDQLNSQLKIEKNNEIKLRKEIRILEEKTYGLEHLNLYDTESFLLLNKGYSK